MVILPVFFPENDNALRYENIFKNGSKFKVNALMGIRDEGNKGRRGKGAKV